MADDAKDNAKLVIRAGSVTSLDDFHAEIKALLQLDGGYGANLDAFNDVLRGGCGKVDPAGKVFVWKGHAAAKSALGASKFNTILEIFHNDDNSGHEAFVVQLE
jgi:RNAse (barnase) inhibitor barstar